MPTADFDDAGLRVLAQALTDAAVKAPYAVKAAIDRTLAGIVADAQAIVPVDTGFLKGSISWESQRNGNIVKGEAGPTALYGAYVEEGTSRMPGRPYMEPAARRQIPLLEQALTQLGTL